VVNVDGFCGFIETTYFKSFFFSDKEKSMSRYQHKEADGRVRNLTHRELQVRKAMEATKRADAYGLLTNNQKIAKLNKKLGKGIGAKKQRARLSA